MLDSILTPTHLIHIVTFLTAPHTEATAQGDTIYSKVVREGVRRLEAYVEEIATGGSPPTAVNIDKVQEDVLKLWNVVKSQPEISQEQKNRIKALYGGVVRSLRKSPMTETRRVRLAPAIPPPNSCDRRWSFRRQDLHTSSASPSHGNIPATSRVSISTSSTKLRRPAPQTKMRFSLVLERVRLELKSSKVSSLAAPMSPSPPRATAAKRSNIRHFPDAW